MSAVWFVLEITKGIILTCRSARSIVDLGYFVEYVHAAVCLRELRVNAEIVRRVQSDWLLGFFIFLCFP